MEQTSNPEQPFTGHSFDVDGFDTVQPRAPTTRSRRIRSVVRTAAGLVGGGIFFLLLSVVMFFAGHDKYDFLPGFILGIVCLIPGCYASLLAFGAYRKWKGYAWENLPGYQELE